MKRLLAFVFTAALAAPLAAQEPAGPERPARDEMFKMVDAYIVSNLQESLGLTDPQFVKILPLVKKAQTDRRSFAQRRMMAMSEMGRLLQSGTATEPRIAEILKELKQREVEDAAAQLKNLEAIDSQLSVVQQAKLRILMVRVEQNIRELIGRGRPQAGPGQRRREGPPPINP